MAIRPLMLLAATMIAGCGGSSIESDDANPAATRAISIPFAAFAGDTQIDCDASLGHLGIHGASAQLSDFKLFIHNVRLVTDEGVEVPLTLDEVTGWQTDGIALLDFQNRGDSCNAVDEKPVNTSIHGRVPEQPLVYSGVRFTVGVPVSHNHNDSAMSVAPLNVAAMFWSWRGGYKHMRFDVRPLNGVDLASGATSAVWQFHLGDTDCSADPIGHCNYRNRPEIALDGFIENEIRVLIDYAALVQSSDLNSDAGGPSGCMSGTGDPECVDLFDQLGLILGDGEGPASAQTVFSIELAPGPL
ncbi:MAG: MbnP family copper-binding protein [Alcanivoracaceae bacterium]